jgi:hypothetical protein
MVFLLTFVSVMAFAQNIPRNVERWEYNFAARIANHAKFNRLGAEGWQYVGSSSDGNGAQVFIRRLP